MESMDKRYSFEKLEKQWYSFWEEKKFFAADAANKEADPYTIVIPPPNVTAPLHLGHALNNTLQDIMVRSRRMQGRNALWMPGTDHAGIATQTVVEKRLLASEGKRRTEYERDDFVGRVQAWKDEYEATILGQLKAMGCSCDWDRTRFTMDEMCAKAVRENFFKLFKDGLIYRGKRLVNWDPATQTVLADDEVEHEMVQGAFWYMRYPLTEPVVVDGETISFVTVATTRPETMLGDTAVAVNPHDPKSKALIGKQVRLPLVGRLIPIIGDEYVVLPDPESDDEKAKYGTGFLKVTPAHDPNDWAIGLRHDLEVINVMAPDGTISSMHGWDDASPEVDFLLGMDRFKARDAIVDWFKAHDLLAQIRDYAHEVGHSYRSHVPIEPYLSDQWYIAVKKPLDNLIEKFGSGLIEGTDVPRNSLAGLALTPLLDKKINFIPGRYAKTYQTWLENLRDWPISRQLWWGHQIPVWFGTAELPEEEGLSVSTVTDDEGETINYICVAPGNTALEEKLEAQGYMRDPDVLDTWFSSALWPFSTLGWPDATPELDTFYPGNVLCTAREIITLWVSRMVMMGQYCMGDVPYTDIFIHAMIQDGDGRKMSKSLGNGIDPLVVIDSHGSDAMRFTLAGMTTDTQDIRMPVVPITLPDGRVINSSPKFDGGRNFCNKLWNASRFVMSRITSTTSLAAPEPAQMHVADIWIISRLHRTILRVDTALEKMRFSEMASALYEFFWHDYCDWYIEFSKYRLYNGTEQQQQAVLAILVSVLDSALRLLHPIMPFITEEIWQKLPRNKETDPESIMVAPWPAQHTNLLNDTVEEQMAMVQEIATALRTMRAEGDIPPGKEVDVVLNASDGDLVAFLADSEHLFRQCIKIGDFTSSTGTVKPDNALSSVVRTVECHIPLDGLIDVEKEKERINTEIKRVSGLLIGTDKKLANEQFVAKAPAQVVENERTKLESFKIQLEKLKTNLAALEES